MADVIPPLDSRGRHVFGEGPTDFGLYLKPLGTVRAVMVFVDHDDAPGIDDPASVADHLLGGGQAQRLYFEQSQGKLALQVDVRSDLKWRRLPRRSDQYGELGKDGVTFPSIALHRQYISDAANAFTRKEVDFSRFQVALVVAPREAKFSVSPAFIAGAADAVVAPGGARIRHAVTFGRDSYHNRFINLVHEVGHVFGLPDQYPFDVAAPADRSAAGCWSIMSDIFRANGFLAWDRRKNGWLDTSQMRYLSAPGRQVVRLAPPTERDGVQMVVVPVDDPQSPSRVLVMEVAQPGVGKDDLQPTPAEGVLVYEVDGTLDTGRSPVKVLPRAGDDPFDPNFGNLFQAPLRVNESRPVEIGNALVNLRVVDGDGASFTVEVDYQRR
jgi:M6 family metalloprotease-like protein